MPYHPRNIGGPPVPLARSSRGTGGGSSRRSRSRSRSPRGSAGGRGSTRYSSGGGGGDGAPRERDSRDLRDSRGERDRDRDRDRERDRRRSGSPYGGRDRGDRKPTSSSTPANTSKSAAPSDSIPAVSIIHSETHVSIVRRILNPDEVKIPRRVNEGSKPIFERDELREAMLRRMRNNDNEENPPQANAYIQEPAVTQQRVVAIIREPVGGSPLDAYLANKDPAFHHSVNIATAGGAAPLQRVSPERRTSSYGRRSPSPRTVRQSSSAAGARRPSAPAPRSPPPPLLSSRSADREREQRERERIIMERERALEREREQLIREREQHGGGRERLPVPERDREFRDRDRELHRPDERNERERENRATRFNAAPPGLQSHPRLDVRQRIRSRSPVTRILREDGRLQRRRSRSHSVTPPPMPDEFRQRMILERQKQIDLRSSLSRQPAKFGDDRGKGRPGPPVGRGGRGGRGGFPTRSVRGREDERRAWLHDMYDGGDEPKKG